MIRRRRAGLKMGSLGLQGSTNPLADSYRDVALTRFISATCPKAPVQTGPFRFFICHLIKVINNLTDPDSGRSAAPMF